MTSLCLSGSCNVPAGPFKEGSPRAPRGWACSQGQSPAVSPLWEWPLPRPCSYPGSSPLTPTGTSQKNHHIPERPLGTAEVLAEATSQLRVPLGRSCRRPAFPRRRSPALPHTQPARGLHLRVAHRAPATRPWGSCPPTWLVGSGKSHCTRASVLRPQ